MINNKNKYSKHILLNSDETSFSGNIKVFYGKAFWDKKGEHTKEILFSISDCNNSARIHTKNSSKKEIKRFVAKLRKIEKTAKDFADYLEAKI